jgi:hypothetical protein
MKPEDREEARQLAALSVLWQLLAAAKAQTDVVDWRGNGGPEAEVFLDALQTGKSHPLLRRWKELNAIVAANRPAPDPLDLNARRLTVLMVETLSRAGLSKTKAREKAAATMF